MNRKPQPEIGTVSWGTMRPQDLIPSFLDVLHAHASKETCRRIHRTYADVFRSIGQLAIYHRDPWEVFIETSATHEETAGFLLSDLFDALEETAPEGCYFGAIDGDGADYGFWPSEPEEETYPDNDAPTPEQWAIMGRVGPTDHNGIPYPGIE